MHETAHARTHTHHTAFTVQAQAALTYMHMHRLSALTYCLSQSGPGVAAAAENFDVFTAGAINHEPPYKCLLVPGLFLFFFSPTNSATLVGVQRRRGDNELHIIVST